MAPVAVTIFCRKIHFTHCIFPIVTEDVNTREQYTIYFLFTMDPFTNKMNKSIPFAAQRKHVFFNFATIIFLVHPN